MDAKQDYAALKRSGTDSEEEKEEEETSSTVVAVYKKTKVSKFNDENNRKENIASEKRNTSPSPRKTRSSGGASSTMILACRQEFPTSVNIGQSSSVSPAKDGKRANKPLMEKRRRARINQSLALLKTLILDSTKNDNTRHSKLEKADILELTVRYLQRQKILNTAELDKYKAGFQDCTKEVTRFLDTPELHLCNTDSSKSPKHNNTNSLKHSNSIFIEPAVKQRLLRHLNSCSSEIDLDFSKSNNLQKKSPNPSDCPTSPYTPPVIEESSIKAEIASVKFSETNSETKPLEVQEIIGSSNQLTTKTVSFANGDDSMLSVLQVIPSRLSDGQVVFLLPSHYMQLAEEFQKKAALNSTTEKHKNINPETSEPLDFSIKKDDSMWRPW